MPGPKIATVTSLAGGSRVSNYWSREHQDAPYDAYFILPTYAGLTGAYQQGVAGPANAATPTPCEVVQLEAPTMRLTLFWLAQRLGLPPAVPDPRPPSGTKFTLLRYAILPASPRPTADGLTYLWTAGGVYQYAVATPVPVEQGFPTGAMPYQSLTASQLVFGANNFRSTIFGLA